MPSCINLQYDNVNKKVLNGTIPIKENKKIRNRDEILQGIF